MTSPAASATPMKLGDGEAMLGQPEGDYRNPNQLFRERAFSAGLFADVAAS